MAVNFLSRLVPQGVACWLGVAILLDVLVVDVAAADRDSRPIEFNRDIRPILSDHCFACHGPDQNTREADVRFDTEEGLFGDGDSGGPVVASDLEASELFRRVTAPDDDERMPPREFGKDLSAEQVDLLRRWIEQGAPWQGHWAFQPVTRPEPPEVATSTVGNAIDSFVVAELERQELSYSPPSDRRTLARRLSFDLLGLPPTPAAVEEFVASKDPLAYEKLVDELLASPHFGERMAMWWLDLVRYADSVGYHGDQPVSVSPFRDYVIAAFNDNKPFDQFTVEQLAGDLLPEPTREQQIAAGYNRLGMMSAEGGVQPKEYLAKYIAERVRNLGGTWLGVTLGCCECHDHKYDPFSTKDFYRFEAFFADIEERGLYGGDNWGPKMLVPSDEQQKSLSELDARLAATRATLEQPTAELEAAQLQWEQSQTPWQVLRPTQALSAEGATLEVQDDGSVLAKDKSPDTDITTLHFTEWPHEMTALRIEVLPDPSLPKQGPGRADNGNFVLSELELQWVTEQGPRRIPLQRASATYEQTGAAESHPDKKWTAASAIDGDQRGAAWGWAILEQAGQVNAAVFELEPTSELPPSPPLSAEEPAPAAAMPELQIVLKQNHDSPRHTLGRFRVLATTAQLPIEAEALPPDAIRDLLAIAVMDRSAEQVAELAKHYRSIAPELAPVRKQLEQLEAERQALEQSIQTMLITQTVKPRTVRVLARGNWMDDSGPEMQPAIPELLGGRPADGDRRLTRLDLAQWVTAPENPLTARVAVNRLWKLLFGVGLSNKLDDLGAQGEWPSHPDLLDWLADEFAASGWNVKHMIKLMVMSNAYRQSSFASPDMLERDPYNRLLARQGRWRLDAELVRDNLLSFSGLLVDSIGGESVKPYQPAGYWSYLNFPQREWTNGEGTELYRRGVYTHWQRQYLHPSLLAFDAPSREECTADRTLSNTPLQALVLLNDPTYVEAARAFAWRILQSGEPSDSLKITWAIREALTREPREEELPVLIELLDKHRREFQAEPQSAEQLLSVGSSPLPEGVDAGELAAWISVARTLFNLHETITRN